MSYSSMTRTIPILLICLSFSFSSPSWALQDQGLSSILSIIDKAVDTFTTKFSGEEGTEPAKESDEKQEEKAEESDAASSTVMNLSRTLGKLSYSRLQCGQADVLAEFTQRVQKMPAKFRDAMRVGFQEGFDQSKKETPLLSADECERLTQSRNIAEKKAEDDATEENKEEPEVMVEKPPEPPVDPGLKHMRIAELSGQLAYKRKYCGDNKVVNRDFNEVIGNMPDEYQDKAKKAYWKGYTHGKRMNKNLTQAKCN